MENIEAYFMQYKGETNNTSSVTYNDYGDYWVGDYIYPYPYYPSTYTYLPPVENKTERAFKILKVLVKEKLIKEPTSFNKFVEIVEKIAKVI